MGTRERGRRRRRVTLVRIAVYASLPSAIVISCHSPSGNVSCPIVERVTTVQPPACRCIIGDDHESREAAHARRAPGGRRASWRAQSSPRRRPNTGRSCIRSCRRSPSGPVVVVAMRADRACEQRQTANTRLVDDAGAGPVHRVAARARHTRRGVARGHRRTTHSSAAMPKTSCSGAASSRGWTCRSDPMVLRRRRAAEEPESVPGTLGPRVPRGRPWPAASDRGRRAGPRAQPGGAGGHGKRLPGGERSRERGARSRRGHRRSPQSGRRRISNAARCGCAWTTWRRPRESFRRRRMRCRGSAPRGAISAPRSANWTARPRHSRRSSGCWPSIRRAQQAVNNVGRGDARAGPAGRIGSGVPAGDRTRAESRVWLLQSGTHAVPAGALSGGAPRLCAGPGARSRAESRARVPSGDVPGGHRRCRAAR